MKILKVFRRYNHILLMVFMSLLLITFLIPQTLRGCGDQRGLNDAVGTAFGKTIFQNDLRRTAVDMEAVGQLGVPLPADNRLDNYLLMEEARRLGIRLGRDTVKQSFASSPAAERLSDVASRQNRSVDSLYDALGDSMAVDYAFRLQFEAMISTQPRVEVAYRDQNEQAIVKLSVISSDAFLEQAAEPTEREIAALFEEGKDRETSHEDDVFKFGYRYDDRVAIEYLTVDPAKIKDSLRVRDKEAREHYEQNKTRYVDTVPRLLPSSQPTRPRFERRQLSFEEARQRVKRDKREIKAAEVAQRLMNEIKRAADRPWATTGMGDDDYLIVPDGAADVSFEELRDRFSQSYEVEYHKTELLDALGLRDLSNIGRARATGSRGLGASFENLALRVKGLATLGSGGAAQGLNPFEPSDVIMTQQFVGGVRGPYQAFLFRIIEVAPAAPPAAVDAVRDKVIEDIKLMKAHDIAKGHAEQLLSAAKTSGLAAAVEGSPLKQILLDAQTAAGETAGGTVPFGKKYADALEPFTPTQRLTRNSFSVDARVGAAGPLPEKVFEIARQPVSPEGRRLGLVQLVIARKWVLVELEEIKPIYQGEFDRRRQSLAAQNLRFESFVFRSDWINSDNIRLRTGFQPPQQADSSSAGQ